MVSNDFANQKTFSQMAAVFFVILIFLAIIPSTIMGVLGFFISLFALATDQPSLLSTGILLLTPLSVAIVLLAGFVQYWHGTLSRNGVLVLWTANSLLYLIPLAQIIYMIHTEEKTTLGMAILMSFLTIPFLTSVCAFIESCYCQK